MAIRVYVEDAGCDRRKLDAETIRRYLEANGYAVVNDPREADRIVAVTCAFKDREEDESIRRLRSLRRYGRDLLVYGCLPDLAGERYTEFEDLPAVTPRTMADIERFFPPVNAPLSAVPPANVIGRRAPALTRARRRLESGILPRAASARTALTRAVSSGEVFSTANGGFNLFVSRGCMGSCAYCAIRRAIGPVVSKPIDTVVAELTTGLEQGYRTFSVLGDDPGCYGWDRSATLPELMRALFEATDEWLAAGPGTPDGTGQPVGFHVREIHPANLIRYGEQLCELPSIDHLAGILCPVQSGSDRILNLMQREHTADELLQVLERVRARRPDAELSTQIIVGFPTETDEDFSETLAFLTRARFNAVVVFPYAEKHGTAAVQIADKVAPHVIERRVRQAERHLRSHGVPVYLSCP